ncbi:hypothetical protein LXL04_034867 [Taraxacum kok-saghyz]
MTLLGGLGNCVLKLGVGYLLGDDSNSGLPEPGKEEARINDHSAEPDCQTHIFPRTRELPQFPISPKPLFLSKNRLRDSPKLRFKREQTIKTRTREQTWSLDQIRRRVIAGEMSETFEGFDCQYCELSASLSKKCTSATLLDGDSVLMSFPYPISVRQRFRHQRQRLPHKSHVIIYTRTTTGSGPAVVRQWSDVPMGAGGAPTVVRRWSDGGPMVAVIRQWSDVPMGEGGAPTVVRRWSSGGPRVAVVRQWSGGGPMCRWVQVVHRRWSGGGCRFKWEQLLQLRTESWDLLRTHIFSRTRELPQFPISPKPLLLSKNRLRDFSKRLESLKFAEKNFEKNDTFLKKKLFFRKTFFATGLKFERFLAPRSRFFEKVNVGYPRDAPATVLFGEWFRFGKPSDQYPHNVALTTHFRLMVSFPKTRQKDSFTKSSNLPKGVNAELLIIHMLKVASKNHLE